MKTSHSQVVGRFRRGTEWENEPFTYDEVLRKWSKRFSFKMTGCGRNHVGNANETDNDLRVIVWSYGPFIDKDNSKFLFMSVSDTSSKAA